MRGVSAKVITSMSGSAGEATYGFMTHVKEFVAFLERHQIAADISTRSLAWARLSWFGSR